ncbi:MAG TPA: hypothetical protein VIV58_13695 [Kofleriaceae bacterium]
MKLLACAVALVVSSSAFADTVAKADGDKFVAFFDKLADTVVADKADCSKMATDVNASIEANKAVIDAAKEAMKSGKKMPDDMRQRVMAAGKRIAQAESEKCSNDKAVQAAMHRLPGPKH